MNRDKTAQLTGYLTSVQKIDPLTLALLRSLAAQAIVGGKLNWRHNGQGMLQAYLFEGLEVEGRIHVWHDGLRKPGIADNGLAHDHRFDMSSYVILGGVEHVEYSLSACEDGAEDSCRIVEVTNARKAKASPGSEDYHMDPTMVGGNFHMEPTVFDIRDACYDFPRFRYHKATNVGSPTVTLVMKSRQMSVKARLLDQYTSGPLINSFEDTLRPDQFQHILDEVAGLLV